MDAAPGRSLLTTWGQRAGAVLTGLAALGVLLGGVLWPTPAPRQAGRGRCGACRRCWRAPSAWCSGSCLPDYRLLAATAYTPILLALALVGAVPEGVRLWPWPVVNMAVLTVAGFAWITTAAGRWAAPARQVPVLRSGVSRAG